LSVVVVGLEHRTSPLDLLERVAVADGDVPKLLGELRDRINLQESVLLSTCLRTEVYAVVDRFHDAVSEVQDVLVEHSRVDLSDLEPHLSIRFDDDVAAHLFDVASGLESIVLGESEVLGQVRRSWERAQEERVCGPVLAGLFRHAVQTGKRVRSETAIARGTTSFSHAALQLVEHRRGGLAGTSVVVVGAGEMGSGLLSALSGLAPDHRPAEVTVANRTRARAAELAGRVDGPAVAVGWPDIGTAVAGADVVFVAVDAEAPVLTAEDVAPAGDRRTRPLLVVDLGMPRNVDRRVASLGGVSVIDMEDLRASVTQVLDERRGEAELARAIVAEEVGRYREASRARGAAPVVAALRSRLEALRVAELDRRRNQFAALSDEDWTQVDAVTRSVLAKLVHEPTVLLKDTAGTPRGERLVEALRILFDL